MIHSFLGILNSLYLRLAGQPDALDPDQWCAIVPTVLACEDARLYLSERLGAVVRGVDAGVSQSA
jgi:hypothetical protein